MNLDRRLLSHFSSMFLWGSFCRRLYVEEVKIFSPLPGVTNAWKTKEERWESPRANAVVVKGDRRTEARWIEARGTEARGTEAMGD